MLFNKTKLPGVVKITLDNFQDFRGGFSETYNRDIYIKNGIGANFVQDDLSISDRNVLRGLHGDAETHKLVSCVYGKIYLVVVNVNEKTPEYGIWEAFTLSGENREQIYIPPYYVNGYYVLSEKAIFSYKQSTYYVDSNKQYSYVWNDEKFNIWWPCTTPLLSRRDSHIKM